MSEELKRALETLARIPVPPRRAPVAPAPEGGELVTRLRSNSALPICPYDRKSPEYWTMPDDKPCPFCGQENTLEGPDKCTGADTRLFAQAADLIDSLTAREAELREAAQGLLDSLAADDDEGMMEHAEPVRKLRAALARK